MKRLILLCDGTLEDADRQPDEARITNIARLSRAIVEMDRRDGKEVEQVKLYQSGVGTDETGAGSLITVRAESSFPLLPLLPLLPLHRASECAPS